LRDDGRVTAPTSATRTPFPVPSWLVGVVGLLLVATAIVERLQGHVWWCACGSPVPWAWDIWSRHNSQHLVDPYTLTHVLHGIVFYALFRVALPRAPVPTRALCTTGLEALWEMLENSHWVIDRYRAETISLDYFGDSIVNSMSDVAACLAGFVIAAKLPWKASLAIFIAVELVLLLWIRDNLTLNVIMLVAPLDAIRRWQMAGHSG
jgi:hypothetical protein